MYGAFYKRTYRCLLDRGEFSAFRIYPSKTREHEKLDEFLDVPYFIESPDGVYGNVTMQEVYVCPTCGFASNDDGFFEGESQYEQTLELSSREITFLLTAREARLDVLARMTRMYECPRTLDDALISLELGVMCSQTLYEMETIRFSIETLRIANYSLKAARLCRENNRPGTELEWLFKALGWLNKALESGIKGLARFRMLYQLLALGIMVGENKLASTAYMRLSELAKEEEHPDLSRYVNRAKGVWGERRELYDEMCPELLK